MRADAIDEGAAERAEPTRPADQRGLTARRGPGAPWEVAHPGRWCCRGANVLNRPPQDQPLNSLLNAAISESIGLKAPATGLLLWHRRAEAATTIM